MIEIIIELIGTFIFVVVLLQQAGQAIPVAIALATVIFFGGAISGGHFNPAVSFMSYLNGGLNGNNLIMYIIAQIIGSVCALYFHKSSLGLIKLPIQ